MNATQLQTTLAPIVSFLAGLLAAKVPFLDVGTWTTLIGAVLGIVATVWGAFAAKKTSLISTVAADPDVQSIKLEPSAPNAVLQATPSNVNK